ncbi:MAG: hypothetical protein AcusKO_16980 [Acuticoccus sp.]
MAKACGRLAAQIMAVDSANTARRTPAPAGDQRKGRQPKERASATTTRLQRLWPAGGRGRHACATADGPCQATDAVSAALRQECPGRADTVRQASLRNRRSASP